MQCFLPFQAFFSPLSSWISNARKTEESKPSGVSSNGSQGLLHFMRLKSLPISELWVCLQCPPSPVKVEKFWVRNYHDGWLPESINHTYITTLLFLPSLLLSSLCVLTVLTSTQHRLLARLLAGLMRWPTLAWLGGVEITRCTLRIATKSWRAPPWARHSSRQWSIAMSQQWEGLGRGCGYFDRWCQGINPIPPFILVNQNPLGKEGRELPFFIGNEVKVS